MFYQQSITFSRRCCWIISLMTIALLGCQSHSGPPPIAQKQQLDAGPMPEARPQPAAAPESPSASETVKLEVVDKEGFEKALAAKRGKIVLVDAWATWCVPCKKGFRHTVELHETYGPQGLAVISLSMDDKDAHDEALKFLTDQQAHFTNLRSELGADDAAFEQFDIDGGALPHLKLYDREGKLVKKFVSGDVDQVFEPKDVELAIRELIAK